MTTSRAVWTQTQNLLTYLLQTEIAVFANPVVNDGGRVTWKSLTGGGPFLDRRDGERVSTYRRWVAQGAYSAILFDASLLQLTYDFDGSSLVSHRLAWVPCPFRVDPLALRIDPIDELMEEFETGPVGEVMLRTPVRFDYDADAPPDHPRTHLSLNNPGCRIACAAPVPLGMFTDFVFKNFYPAIWEGDRYVRSMPRKALADHTVTDLEAAAIHMSWPR